MLLSSGISNNTKNNQIVTGAFWLIRLRWIAVAGIIGALLIAKFIFSISIQQKPILYIASVLFILNLFSLIALMYYLKTDNSLLVSKTKFLIIIQIVTDLIILTSLLHFSGGIENPLVIYYIFHMIIASILLPPRTSYIITSYALILICLLTVLEYHGILPHYCLIGFNENNFYLNKNFLIGTGLIFITTSYLIVYMTLSVTSKLRLQEEVSRKAIIELENKDVIKNEYVLRITHDIKDHLATIQNSLVAVGASKSESEKQEFIQRAYERTRTLSKFTQNLLKLTRLRLQKHVSMSFFSLRDTINNVINELISDAQSRGIKITSDIQNKIGDFFGEQLSFEEALKNLLSNAIKYSYDNSEVTVKVKSLKNKVIIEVIDRGIGIPKYEQKLIFNEFYRGSNVINSKYIGSGFGLSLVHRIIENHNGKINIESKLDKGTKVSITIPVQKKGQNQE
jgi:signal transduction histidine kinase